MGGREGGGRNGRLTDQGDGRAVLQRRDGGPLARALLPGAVPDLGEQVGARRVAELEDVGGDLDEEGVQLSLVPLVELLGMCSKREKKKTRTILQLPDLTGHPENPPHENPYFSL